jgi:hypothetical protein
MLGRQLMIDQKATVACGERRCDNANGARSTSSAAGIRKSVRQATWRGTSPQCEKNEVAK